MTRPAPSDPFASFDHVYIVNLVERRDRRREMERELRRRALGLTPDTLRSKIEFFPAVRPATPEPFANNGTKGCSLSHLGLLRDAQARGFTCILVLEDDAIFSRAFARRMVGFAKQLQSAGWSIAQLGYGLFDEASSPAASPVLVRTSVELIGTHCYAVNENAIGPLADLFERQHAGRPGDDRFGPMPADGTLNVFALAHPEPPRLIPVPSAVDQRSSRSDVIEAAERGSRPLMFVGRRLRRIAQRLR